MPRRLQPCGTRAAFLRHRRNGEEPCDACRAARNKHERERKARIKSGKPAPTPKSTLRKRLLSKATINWETGCWEWTDFISEHGYGRIYANGKQGQLAHRVAYELVKGPIPAGLDLDHLCRVRRCINPAHLEPVTSAENTRRGVSYPALNALKTHCISGHEFTPKNTRRSKTGRACKECERVRSAQYQIRKKASRAVTS